MQSGPGGKGTMPCPCTDKNKGAIEWYLYPKKSVKISNASQGGIGKVVDICEA
jgi:hypothetical protein